MKMQELAKKKKGECWIKQKIAEKNMAKIIINS